MKLVKLNRNYTAYKNLGHKWAFRFDSYDPKICNAVEKIFRDMHGSHWRWGNNSQRNVWDTRFGHRSNRQTTRPYWITFTNEQDATIVYLKLQEQS